MSESGEKGLGLNVPPLDSVFEIIFVWICVFHELQPVGNLNRFGF